MAYITEECDRILKLLDDRSRAAYDPKVRRALLNLIRQATNDLIGGTPLSELDPAKYPFSQVFDLQDIFPDLRLLDGKIKHTTLDRAR
jgi:hypothetical protein